MMDLIVGGIIIVILAMAIRSIMIAKKKGIKCIGCDFTSSCSTKKPEDNQTTGCTCGHAPSSGCAGCPSNKQ